MMVNVGPRGMISETKESNRTEQSRFIFTVGCHTHACMHVQSIPSFLPYTPNKMSSPRDDSRTNSVYVDAPEYLSSTAGGSELEHAAASAASTSTPPFEHTPEPEEDDDFEDDEDENENDSEDSHSHSPEGTESRGRSRTVEPEDAHEDRSESDEELVMQLDHSTGVRRATSVTRSSQVRARSTSVADRLRRQHRRMTSAARASASRSGSRSSSRVAGSAAGTAAAGTSSSAKQTPVVDEQAQNELRRKIMDIQRDPTISFADKAKMIQVRLATPICCS